MYTHIQAVKSSYLGTVGEKINLTLTIVGVNSFDSGFGESNVYQMVDVFGNHVTKFGRLHERYLINGSSVVVGSVVKFRAMVKKQEVFIGKKQTTIGRISKFS